MWFFIFKKNQNVFKFKWFDIFRDSFVIVGSDRWIRYYEMNQITSLISNQKFENIVNYKDIFSFDIPYLKPISLFCSSDN